MLATINRIEPDPILSAVVEIRFTPLQSSGVIISAIAPILPELLNNIKPNDIPKNVRKITPGLEFSADYFISNSQFSVGINEQGLTFQTNGDYPLWPVYSSFIFETLKKIGTLNLITGINRIGVRYSSIFPVDENLKTGLNIDIKFIDSNTVFQSEFYRFTIDKSPIILTLQAGQNVTAKRSDSDSQKQGLYLDIDAFQISELDSIISENTIRSIESLHVEEKKLFESILSESFRAKLKIS